MSDMVQELSPPKMGVKAVIESDVISHERLPMLEVVYHRMVRTFTTSMRNLTSDMIEVRGRDLPCRHGRARRPVQQHPPYATIEPVRHKLAQGFMGEKHGRDTLWKAHMECELPKTEVTVDVVLGERIMTLSDVRGFAIGQTIALTKGLDDPLALHCGGIPLGHAHIGQRCNNIAIRLATDISGHPQS